MRSAPFGATPRSSHDFEAARETAPSQALRSPRCVRRTSASTRVFPRGGVSRRTARGPAESDDADPSPRQDDQLRASHSCALSRGQPGRDDRVDAAATKRAQRGLLKGDRLDRPDSSRGTAPAAISGASARRTAASATRRLTRRSRRSNTLAGHRTWGLRGARARVAATRRARTVRSKCKRAPPERGPRVLLVLALAGRGAAVAGRACPWLRSGLRLLCPGGVPPWPGGVPPCGGLA